MSFAEEFRRAMHRVEVEVASFRGRLGMEVHRRSVQRTPRVTGRLAASWTVSRGAPDFQDGFSGSTLDGAVSLGTVLPGEPVFVANGVEYAAPVEYGTRHFSGRLMLTNAVMETETWAQSLGDITERGN